MLRQIRKFLRPMLDSLRNLLANKVGILKILKYCIEQGGLLKGFELKITTTRPGTISFSEEFRFKETAEKPIDRLDGLAQANYFGLRLDFTGVEVSFLRLRMLLRSSLKLQNRDTTDRWRGKRSTTFLLFA